MLVAGMEDPLANNLTVVSSHLSEAHTSVIPIIMYIATIVAVSGIYYEGSCYRIQIRMVNIFIF